MRQSERRRASAFGPTASRNRKGRLATRRIAELTWQRFGELVPGRIERVLVPVGTMEAHGVLPLGTDTLIPDRLADRLAGPLDALVAPPMPYGLTSSLRAYPGSMTLEMETFQDVMYQVGAELGRNGFRRIVFLNGHGGQTHELRTVVDDLHRDHDLFSMVVEWWPLGADACRDVFGAAGGHAGVDETAAVTALAPDLVEARRMKRSLSYRVRPGLAARPAPGPILHFGDDEGEPVFDSHKAALYAARMVDSVQAAVQEVLAAWETNLHGR
ncbi:MAG: creatininase family protein [Acidobacteriota bacterium]